MAFSVASDLKDILSNSVGEVRDCIILNEDVKNIWNYEAV